MEWNQLQNYVGRVYRGIVKLVKYLKACVLMMGQSNLNLIKPLDLVTSSKGKKERKTSIFSNTEDTVTWYRMWAILEKTLLFLHKCMALKKRKLKRGKLLQWKETRDIATRRNLSWMDLDLNKPTVKHHFLSNWRKLYMDGVISDNKELLFVGYVHGIVIKLLKSLTS